CAADPGPFQTLAFATAPDLRRVTSCRTASRAHTRNDRETPMDLGLKGRVAVITGPAKGMGAAVSKAFAAEGCKLALIGRDTKAITPVAEEIQHAGGEAIVLRCDVTSPKACQDAAEATKEFGGRIDILVNVAGGSGPIGKTGAETTTDEFDEIVTLNM